MSYLWIKSLHVAAVLLFTGGLMALAVVTAAWVRPGEAFLSHETRIGQAVMRWDRCVTVPAMTTTWILGLGLAVWGGWTFKGWFIGKMVLVALLTGIHGVLAATVRKQTQGAASSPIPWLRYTPMAVGAGLILIAVLVVVKP